MTLPTEPIGSIPRPEYLIEGLGAFAAGRIDAAAFAELESRALADTISRFEETGSPVVSDGEQGKPSFATYPLAGLTALAPDGVVIPFADGHTRRLPRLTAGPFRYATHADAYLTRAKALTGKPVKQAVIAASALSPDLPGRRHRGLLAGPVRRRPRRRSRSGYPAQPRRRRAQRPDRLHRGAAVAEARPVGRAAAAVRRPQQRRARPVHGGGAREDRRPHLPGRRPGLGAQPRRRLRGPAAGPFRVEGGQLLRPARERSRAGTRVCR